MSRIISGLRAVVPLLLLICFFHPQVSRAANITCADTWSEEGGINEGNLADESTFKEWFPSGRRPTASTCRAIYIEGEIVRGDEDRFQQLLYQNLPFVSTVVLSSHGGNVGAATQIGLLTRKYLLITVAPSLPSNVALQTGKLDIFPGGFVAGKQHITTGLLKGAKMQTLCEGYNCLCASACTNIWAAGSIRFGNAVGVHEAFTEKVEDRQDVGLSPAEVKRPQAEANAFIQKYMEQMEVLPDVISQLEDTSPYGIFWISAGDAAQMAYPPSTLKLFDTCATDFYPLACYIKKMYAARDSLYPPPENAQAGAVAQ